MAMKFDGSKEVTQKLKFKPEPKLGNLCLGYLESVTLEHTESPLVDDKGVPTKWEYAGQNVPKILFIFRNIPGSSSDPDRYYFHSESVVTQVTNKGDAVDPKNVERLYSALFDRLIHIYNAYHEAPNFKPLDLKSEIDETLDAEGRTKQMDALYTELVKAFNEGKDGKPIFKTADDKIIPVVMKLLPDYKNNTRLEFPTFVGEGFIEMYIANRKPTIELKPNESVELVAKKTTASAATATGNKSEEEIPDDVQQMLKDLEEK